VYSLAQDSAGKRPCLSPHLARRIAARAFDNVFGFPDREGGPMPGPTRRQSRSVNAADWPQALRTVIEAAEKECPPGHARALRDMTALALYKVPSRGIFDPGARGEDDLFSAIEVVARDHLELGAARSAWRDAVKAAGLTLDRRD